ncbi:MAG TPA: DNA helicase RecQ [Vicinamibacterales bacterium]|nr:DNA helicase RecQ [Vicinamibacterales bacterium]
MDHSLSGEIFEHNPSTGQAAASSRRGAEDGLREVLHRVWGFSTFRPLQLEAMRAVLDGRDSLVVLPTGGGKSLCFQAPALVHADRSDRERDGRRGFALVVSPLISLMKDQVDGLRVDGVDAFYLNSSQSSREREAVLAAIAADQCRLLYVSPERLVGEGSQPFRRLLFRGGVRFVAIDEAHCISQWGHDFRPEYRQLGCLKDDFPGVSLHAFTATATGRVRQDIVSELRLEQPAVLVGSFNRPNLTYRVLRRSQFQRQLDDILARHQGESGIVYCTSRREVESLTESLVAAGHRAVAYHAGLADEVRARHQEAFLEERADIVVATVAFGMGIDRSNVRFVVHAQAPRSLEHYQQESGRAGRDGLPAECVLIYSSADFVRWRQMLESNGEWSESARTLLRDIERYASGTRCRHSALVEYFGQRSDRSECGACDWCLKELDAVPDASTVARKVLSCVARVNQTWGIGHVADVLTGKLSDKILAARHQELSTFGLLKHESGNAVRGFIEQLIGEGLLVRSGEPYPVLRLSNAGTLFLKGSGECVLYRQAAPPRLRGRARSSPRSGSETVDHALFDALRELRQKIARERGVPPYVIFHDRSLQEMADRKPRTLEDLHEIYGVGARKAEAFGDAFLDAIRTFRRPY